jgi:hypothetical protein
MARNLSIISVMNSCVRMRNVHAKAKAQQAELAMAIRLRTSITRQKIQ